MAFRLAQYEKALALQKENDSLCKAVAGKIDPLMASMRASVDKMAQPEVCTVCVCVCVSVFLCF